MASKEPEVASKNFLLATKSTALVHQLCLIEQRLQKDVGKQELSDLGWTKQKKGNEARAVMAVITRFNEVRLSDLFVFYVMVFLISGSCSVFSVGRL